MPAVQCARPVRSCVAQCRRVPYADVQTVWDAGSCHSRNGSVRRVGTRLTSYRVRFIVGPPEGWMGALGEGTVVPYRMCGVFAASALLMVGCGSDSGSRADSGGSSSPSSVESATVAPEPTLDPAPPASEASTVPAIEAVAIEDAGAVRFDVVGEPDWLTLAGGSVFAYTTGVGRFDATTGELLGTTDVGGQSICLAMDAGFGSVWVGLCGTPSLVRIDPATGDVQATIPLPVSDLLEESSVAAGEGGVFLVAKSKDQIVKVDPSTNTVAAVFDVPPGATAARAGFGSLWVTHSALDVVSRLDPATGEVIASIDVGNGPRFLAIGTDGVWVMNQAGGSLSKIDPATETVVATVQVNDGPIEFGDIAVGGGSVWTRISDHLLARVDEASNRVTQFYDPASGSGSVAADDEAVWLSAHDVNSMWRLPLK